MDIAAPSWGSAGSALPLGRSLGTLPPLEVLPQASNMGIGHAADGAGKAIADDLVLGESHLIHVQSHFLRQCTGVGRMVGTDGNWNSRAQQRQEGAGW